MKPTPGLVATAKIGRAGSRATSPVHNALLTTPTVMSSSFFPKSMILRPHPSVARYPSTVTVHAAVRASPGRVSSHLPVPGALTLRLPLPLVLVACGASHDHRGKDNAIPEDELP